MKPSILVDTGPLVAYFDRDSEHHDWVREQAARLEPGWLTSEPVLCETAHLLGRARVDPDHLLDLLEKKLLQVPLQLAEDVVPIRRLMRRYRDLPMSLADATLVRLSERYEASEVFTLDHHFRIYRRFERRPISVLMPRPSA